MRSRRAAALALAIAVAGACGPRRPPASATEVEDPALLVDTAALGPDFAVQQRIRARFRDRDVIFQAVLEKVGDRLALVALGLQGTRLFAIEQRGKTVRFQRFTDRALPFSPWHILVDVHRAYFRPAGRAGRELARDTIHGGVLVRRTIERPGARPITIDYGPSAPGAPPRLRPVVFVDAELGYRLDVRGTGSVP